MATAAVPSCPESKQWVWEPLGRENIGFGGVRPFFRGLVKHMPQGDTPEASGGLHTLSDIKKSRSALKSRGTVFGRGRKWRPWEGPESWQGRAQTSNVSLSFLPHWEQQFPEVSARATSEPTLVQPPKLLGL